ncbi:general transcription factor 3C polypeptide 1-like isoform X2 [Patiria miniata]|uniref:GTF3C1 extended winged-helix domain-containing protein n=1 Tax=Patiria miniata TaxID=46514 RepID=A0A913ZTD3_PATMI|nr:general transcription factor 3C polypeptide 1-like isoform X2 [Patiria miniata]
MNVLQVIHHSDKCSNGIESLKLLKKLSDDKEEAAEEDSSNNYDPSTSQMVAELPILTQAYNLIDRMQHTRQGITYSDFDRLLQKDGRFMRRLIDRNLLKHNLIKFTMSDKGRQRIRRFQTVDKVTKSTPKKDANSETQATASTSETKVPPHNTTERYRKRRQRVLELIQKNRVQEGCFNMIKEIRQEEAQEGRTTVCDRKSIFRILDQLNKEGLCQTFSTVVMSDDGTESRTCKIILDVGVERNDPRVLHIIQQVKLRMISYKLHHPPPNHTKGKKNKMKIARPVKGRKSRSKGADPLLRKRITQYATLAQPEGSETKTRPAGSRIATHEALLGKTGNSDGDEDVKKSESEDMLPVERQYVPKRNVYGLLPKMGKTMVLHRFVWYLLYGMPRQKSPKAPQSADNIPGSSGNETMIIKQEVDESQQSQVSGELEPLQATFTTGQLQDSNNLIGQSTNQSELTFSSAGQSENLSEVDNSMQCQTHAQRETPIGGQEQTAMSVCQVESAMHLADQSEELSDANSGNQNQSESAIGGLKRTAEGANGQTTSENGLKVSTSEGSSTQSELASAGDLLAIIESGYLPEKLTTSLPTDPVSSLEFTAPNMESGMPNFESTNPDLESAMPNLASTVANLERSVPNLESASPNLEFGASISNVNPASTFPVRQDARNLLLSRVKVYLDVMDWRRFVKPLPEYKDLPHGWCLLGDLFLSMPLVTFCEIISLRYMIEGLEDYLKDPLLKLLLIKDLPDRLRNSLLEERRYIYNMDSNVDLLCTLGLGVYTPHLNENKDVLSMYICRNVRIVDTTSSQPGFYYISDKSYPILKYNLRTLDDVEKYWFDLKVICLDTPLGFVKKNVKGKIIKTKLTGFARKADSYLDPVIEDGRIPGDGKGAGGFDSSLYCHLKRNWTSNVLEAGYMCKQRYHNRFSKGQRNTSERLSNPLKPRTVSLSTRKGVKEKVAVETKLVNVDEHKAGRVGGKGLKRKRSPKPKKESEASIAQKKRREEKKRAKEEKKQQQRQQRAVGIITRKVFSWTPQEDSVLLLCKVASEILNTDQSFKSCITWETIQRVFAKKVPDSVNMEGKDAKVISTRCYRHMKNPDFRTNFSVCLGEVKEDKEILDSIKPLSDRSSIEAASEEFEKLFNKLEAKFRFAEEFNTVLPDDITSLHSNYNVVPIVQTDPTNATFFKDENATDLKRLTLHTIVLSTLSSQNASDYDARLVFKLYEQYDNRLLHDVFLFCRSTGIVNRCSKPKRRIMPCVPMSYQLSMGYIRHFKARMPHELPDEAARCQEKLLESEEDVTFPQVSCGACSCQIFLLSTDQLNCKIVIPKKVIVLDSNLIDQEFLKQSGLLKKSGDFSDSDSDTDEDSEEDENDEEQSDQNEGRDTQIDGVGMEDSETQGIGVIDRVRNVTGVRFDEDNDDEKTTGQAEAMEDQQALDSSISVVEDDANDRSVMDQLNELAEGLVSIESQFSDAIECPSVQQSVIDMDHSYLASTSTVVDHDQPTVNGSGDRGETSLPKSEGTVTGYGDGSGDASQEVWTADPRFSLIDEVLYGVGSSKRQETASPSQAHLKPQPRNATMKCLSYDQVSFTKWLILRGHYAPGVCGKKISTLQENIAFNAFIIKLSLNESSPGVPCQSRPEFQPCASLLEYLLRPCKKFVYLEPVWKPTELGQEASYLEELCQGKVFEQQGDSTQELTQRFTGIGLDAATTTALIQIYEKIKEAGFLGVTVPEVKRIVGRVEAASTVKLSLEKYINLLLDQEMIVEVGSNDLRIVATKHASLWMIHSHRLVIPAKSADSDPLAKRPCLDRLSDTCLDLPSRNELVEGESSNTEIVDLTGEPLVPQLQSEYSVEKISMSEPGQRLSPLPGSGQVLEVTPEDDPLAEGSGGKGHQEVTVVGSPEDAAEEVLEIGEATDTMRESSDGGEASLADRSSSTDSDHGRAVKRKFATVIDGVYEPVDFVPRPWCKVNGKVNRPELCKMIRGIALKILAEPGIKESQIVHHLRIIFRKVDSLKLLQIMSDLGLITRHCVTLPKPSLFGRTKSRSQPTVYYYHPSINCLTIMGALFDEHQDTQD